MTSIFCVVRFEKYQDDSIIFFVPLTKCFWPFLFVWIDYVFSFFVNTGWSEILSKIFEIFYNFVRNEFKLMFKKFIQIYTDYNSILGIWCWDCIFIIQDSSWRSGRKYRPENYKRKIHMESCCQYRRRDQSGR